MPLKKILPMILVFFSSTVLADGQYIVLNAKVTKVVNTSGNGASFMVVTAGGTGPCTTTTIQNNIYFPKSAAGTDKVFDRAYSTALTALVSGSKVNIYNYVDGACDKAAAIEIMAD
ncbi:MAG: hypothetical protein ACI8WB_001554 [Phenylobacterium sp.]|jgi:hypothetical protein